VIVRLRSQAGCRCHPVSKPKVIICGFGHIYCAANMAINSGYKAQVVPATGPDPASIRIEAPTRVWV
jgi:hypothetical protein